MTLFSRQDAKTPRGLVQLWDFSTIIAAAAGGLGLIALRAFTLLVPLASWREAIASLNHGGGARHD